MSSSASLPALRKAAAVGRYFSSSYSVATRTDIRAAKISGGLKFNIQNVQEYQNAIATINSQVGYLNFRSQYYMKHFLRARSPLLQAVSTIVRWATYQTTDCLGV